MSESSVVQQPAELQRAPGEGPRSLGESWKDFRSSVEVQSSEGAQAAQQPERNDVDLKKLTPEQLEEWNKTGDLPGSKERKAPEKDSAEKNAKPGTETERDGNTTAKAEAGDRLGEQQPSPYDRLLERASKEPDFDKVVERLHEPFFPLSAEGHARFQVLNHAISQISNAGDVLYFLARPENSSIALKMQDAPPQKIATVVHQISAQLRFGGRTAKRAEESRPRAPKPPSEVGGRGAPHGDSETEAVRQNDFRAAEAIWNKRMK
jgi:hypothetical protein